MDQDTRGAGVDTPPQSGPVIVALVADLLFASRIRGTAALVGARVQVVQKGAALWDAVERARPALVLVDLGAREDAVDVIRRLKASPGPAAPRVVAFGSHVAEEALRAARDAGADRVLARSAFVRVLPSLLAGELDGEDALRRRPPPP